MSTPKEQPTPPMLRETLVITDDQGWIWNLATTVLKRLSREHVRIPSSVPMGSNWQRFCHAPHIIVHWESLHRSGGAVIEDILQMATGREFLSRIIVLTMSPTHEDIVYLGELGISRIVRIRPREKELRQAATDLAKHLQHAAPSSVVEESWRRLLDLLESMANTGNKGRLEEATLMFQALTTTIPSARSLDAEALLSSLRGEDESASSLWTKSIETNPNYYQAYHHLVAHHRRCGRAEKAYAILAKLQEFNKSNISRLVAMGEIQRELSDLGKAELHFETALSRDPHCSRALNGLAAVRFDQGRLDESRDLLSKSQIAFKAAASLNRRGIDLVRAKKYEEALHHYQKAHYVLPVQEKGPLLFYNMGLCYSRWGKQTLAKEYLKIALIKNPSYNKAKALMQTIEKSLGQ